MRTNLLSMQCIYELKQYDQVRDAKRHLNSTDAKSVPQKLALTILFLNFNVADLFGQTSFIRLIEPSCSIY